MTYTSRSLQTLKVRVFLGRVYVAAVDAVVESVMMAVLICFRAYGPSPRYRNLPKAQLGLFSGLSAIAFMMRLRSISLMQKLIY